MVDGPSVLVQWRHELVGNKKAARDVSPPMVDVIRLLAVL